MNVIIFEFRIKLYRFVRCDNEKKILPLTQIRRETTNYFKFLFQNSIKARCLLKIPLLRVILLLEIILLLPTKLSRLNLFRARTRVH